MHISGCSKDRRRQGTGRAMPPCCDDPLRDVARDKIDERDQACKLSPRRGDGGRVHAHAAAKLQRLVCGWSSRSPVDDEKSDDVLLRNQAAAQTNNRPLPIPPSLPIAVLPLAR